MNRLDVSVGKRVRFNGRIREGWWFEPGQTGTVVGFSNDCELPIKVQVDGAVGSNIIANVGASMIDPIDQDKNVSLLEQIAADIKRLLAYVEKQEHDGDRKAWLRSMGV